MMLQTFRAFAWLSDQWRSDPGFKLEAFADQAFRDCVHAHGGVGGVVHEIYEMKVDDLVRLGWHARPGCRCYMLTGQAGNCNG